MENLENLSLAELKAKRDELGRISWYEYTTRGNTERCQHIWKEIEALDEEIENRRTDEEKKRMKKLGCDRCINGIKDSPVCNIIREHSEKWKTCDFFFEEGDLNA